MEVNLTLEIDSAIPRTLVYAEMPVLRTSVAPFFGYPITSDIAVCLSLFNATKTQKHAKRVTFGQTNKVHGYAKRAMYLVYELLNYTNIADCGIPIYVVCTDEVFRIVKEYAKACEFPMRHLLVVDPMDSVVENIQSAKFLCMERVLKDSRIDKVMHIDTSVYFFKDVTYTGFTDWIDLWQDQSFATTVNFKYPNKSVVNPLGSASYRSCNRNVYDDKNYWGGSDKTKEGAYYQALAEFMGFADAATLLTAATGEIPIIAGRGIGMHRRCWEAFNLTDFLNKFHSIHRCDEAFYAVFWYLVSHTIEDVIRLRTSWIIDLETDFEINENCVGFLHGHDAIHNRQKFIELTT